MKTRLLKSILNTGYQLSNEGSYLGVNSPYITGIIRINKETKAITSSEAPNRFINDELKRIWEELRLIEPSVLEDILTGDDVIDNPVMVYYILDGKLVSEPTDNPKWPGITASGRAIYDNTHFLTEREAIEYGISLEEAWVNSMDQRIKDLRSNLDTFLIEKRKHETNREDLAFRLEVLNSKVAPF